MRHVRRIRAVRPWERPLTGRCQRLSAYGRYSEVKKSEPLSSVSGVVNWFIPAHAGFRGWRSGTQLMHAG
jgi:hypothetical protein